MRLIHTIVVHCTATPEGREFTVGAIDKMHRARGFKKIGYHRLVHLTGKDSKGRDDDEVGAHVAGHNTGTLGVSYVGGLAANAKETKDTRTDGQKEGLIRVIKEWVGKYPIKRILGHRDLSPDLDGDGEIEPYEWIKQCPCFDAMPEYASLLGAEADKPKTRKTYTVQAGDSVWKIARANETTAPVLFAANPQIPKSGIIQVGQELVLA